jgi:hypothetical protein
VPISGAPLLWDVRLHRKCIDQIEILGINYDLRNLPSPVTFYYLFFYYYDDNNSHSFQFDTTGDALASIPTSELSPSSTYAVLVFRDNTARKVLHNLLAVVAVSVIAARLYK